MLDDDPRLTYDRAREAPLARDARGRWLVCRHADVVAAATNPQDFSSAVSRFLQVPNGLDSAPHAAARALLDPFFAPERMAGLRPVLERVAAGVLDEVPPGAEVDAVGELGARYAVRAQSAWLGWPASLEGTLLEWMDANHVASRSGDLSRTAAVAAEFDTLTRALLDERRDAGAAAPDDVTTELVRLQDADGAGLSDDVLVSVLRNWTGGDLGSIALCVGVLLHWLAVHPELAEQLAHADDAEVAAAIDEVLRIDDPFVSNRRRAVRDVVLGEVTIPAGDVVVLNWTAANRDPRVFDDPEAFDPHAHAADNLVYGIGPHVCPGRPLATLELLVFVRAVLARADVCLAEGQAPEREHPPVGGYHRVPVVLTPR
nr:cytochrome P450 [Propionicimonas sp.]